MAVDNAARYKLHASAKQALGDEEGDTLMELLPPKWEDFATKHDLDDLRKDLTATIKDTVHEAVTKQTYTLLFSTSALVIAFAGVALGTR